MSQHLAHSGPGVPRFIQLPAVRNTASLDSPHLTSRRCPRRVTSPVNSCRSEFGRDRPLELSLPLPYQHNDRSATYSLSCSDTLPEGWESASGGIGATGRAPLPAVPLLASLPPIEIVVPQKATDSETDSHGALLGSTRPGRPQSCRQGYGG